MAKSPASILYDSTGTNPVAVVLDGSIYRLQVESKLAAGHGLATDASLGNILTELQQKVETTDLATLATTAKQDSLLAELQLKADLTERQPVVLYDASGTAMAVSDGVAIPGGTQTLLSAGKDSSGNARFVGAALDGSAYRLMVDAKLTAAGPGNKMYPYDDVNNVAMAVAEAVSVPANTRGLLAAGKDSAGVARFAEVNVDAAGTRRLQVALPPTTLPGYVPSQTYLLEGSNSGMNVNGSVTPKVYKYVAHATKKVVIRGLNLLMTDNTTPVGSSKFAAGGALTNGVLIQFKKGGSTYTLANLMINENFLETDRPFLDVTGAADVIGCGIDLTLELTPGSTDEVSVTIRDDLTAVEYFKARIAGQIEV